MQPELALWNGFTVSSYAVCVLVGVVLAGFIRAREKTRLGLDQDPKLRVINAAALIGAIAGSKLGMVLFEAQPDPTHAWDLTGKTVVGGLAGGYLAVELSKLALGFRASTGDAWAVALPLAQAFGRLGCFLHGCCYGAPSDLPWALWMHGALRHPVALYEAGGDLAIAAAMYAMREQTGRAGRLFKLYLLSYACLRFALEPLRGDGALRLGPLSSVQWFCLCAALGLGLALWPQRKLRTQWEMTS